MIFPDKVSFVISLSCPQVIVSDLKEVIMNSSAPINIIKSSKVIGVDVIQTYFNLHVEEAWISIEKKRGKNLSCKLAYVCMFIKHM